MVVLLGQSFLDRDILVHLVSFAQITTVLPVYSAYLYAVSQGYSAYEVLFSCPSGRSCRFYDFCRAEDCFGGEKWGREEYLTSVITRKYR